MKEEEEGKPTQKTNPATNFMTNVLSTFFRRRNRDDICVFVKEQDFQTPNYESCVFGQEETIDNH